MAFDYGSVIAAGLNFAGNLATNQINAERAATDMITYLNLVKKQRDWQKEDQQWSEDYAKRMMQFENQNYSSPSAQMEAYKKAGINPWLMSHSDQIGSGQSVTAPGVPSTSRVGMSPCERSPLGNLMEGTADKIFGASQLKSQRIMALSEMAKSIPSIVKGLGSKAALRVLSSLFGNDVETNQIERLVQNEVARSDYETNVSSIQSQIASEYGLKEAGNFVALQQAEFQNYSAKWNLMQKEIEHKDADIRKMAAQYVESVAHAWNLRKQGEYYVASAQTINALRDLTRESLQFQVNSLRRRDVTEQAWFEGERGLRERISSEGDKLTDRFIENWEIQTDPFYNEVGKILNSFHVTTSMHYGLTGGYSTKDVNVYGY